MAIKQMSPDLTVLVVPRERFGVTELALENLYINNPDIAFNVVYVDGGSQPQVQAYLLQQSKARGFEYVRVDRYLMPNEARNIGLQHIRTKYVAILDNDVVTYRGCLRALVECAEQTGAAAVAPVTLEGVGEPDPVVHMTTGECRFANVNGTLYMSNTMDHSGKRLSSLPPLMRQETEGAEFHGLLVRTDVLIDMGGFDEGLKTTREHLDFCLDLKKRGHKIWFEPKALLTYVSANFDPLDSDYYFYRWNEEDTISTIAYFEQKWKVKISHHTLDLVRQRLQRRRDRLNSDIERAALSAQPKAQPAQPSVQPGSGSITVSIGVSAVT